MPSDTSKPTTMKKIIKTITKVTEAKLVKYLESIGWSVRGNNLNRQIINDYDKPTCFFLGGGYDGSGATRLEIRSQSPKTFGDSFEGSFQLSFKDMWIQVFSGKNIHDKFVSLVFPKTTNKGNKTASASFISFYPGKMRDEFDQIKE